MRASPASGVRRGERTAAPRRRPDRGARRAALLALAALAGCAAPARLARVPVGSRLLVACGLEGQLVVHNPQTGSRLRTYDAAPGATALTVTRDGLRAVFADPDGQGLSVLDLAEGLLHRRVPLGGRPRDVAVIDRRTRALVAVEGAAEVRLARLSAGSAEPLGEGLGRPVAVAAAPDLGRAFAADAVPGALVALDLETGRELGRVAVGAGPLRVLRRPGSSELWVACRDERSLAVVDGRTLAVDSVPLDAAPVGLGISRDGRRVLVADAEGARVALLDAAARRVDAWIDLAAALPAGVDATPSGVVVEPDGRYGFVALVHADRVAVVDLETAAVTGTFPTGRGPLALAWTWLARPEYGVSHFPPRFRGTREAGAAAGFAGGGSTEESD